MMKEQNYLVNGAHEHPISPFDRGLSYGDGVFRTFLFKNGLPCDWPLHYQWLVRDCSAIGIVCPSADILMGDILQLASQDEQGVIKVIITRGESMRGYASPPVIFPTRIVTKTPIPNQLESVQVNGIALYLCETRLAIQPTLAGIKHLNRLENVLARAEWCDPAYHDGLMRDTQNNVIECTSANLFARFGQHLVTPDIQQCGIAGVTRHKILERAALLGLSAIEKPLSLPELLLADEVVTCNSVFGVLQVNKMGENLIPAYGLAKKLREVLSA